MTYEVDDRTADFIVEALSKRVEKARRIAASRELAGAVNAQRRKAQREIATAAERAIAGINTGKGVTRRGAGS